jgi:hypothetical protein
LVFLLRAKKRHERSLKSEKSARGGKSGRQEAVTVVLVRLGIIS